MSIEQIEEIFMPPTVTTVPELLTFLADEVIKRGGDPRTIKLVNTAEAIPNVKFSEDWPCWTLKYDKAERS